MRKGGVIWLGAMALAFLLCLVAPAARAAGVNRALLVGCDRFVTQEDTTPSSANNVSRMADALSGGAMNLEVLVTRRNDVTDVDELRELVDEAFSDAREGDVSYFYISTHGLWTEGTPNGDMTLLLSDGEVENGVTARELRTIFDQVPGTKVLMLDACHAGAMIGKGVHAPYINVFEGEDYKVLCSSGGAEESWFWSGTVGESRLSGAGYFSGALVSALSTAGGYGADDNRDGAITLTELKRYLLLSHGASTVRTYPEEDDFPVLTYDATSYTGRRRDSVLESVSFDGGVLDPANPTVEFSFNMLRPAQVAYQIVYQRDGRWDFNRAQLIYDNTERFGAYGDAPGYLSPGMKERTLTLDPDETGGYGYVLLQIITISAGEPSLAFSRVLCAPPAYGNPELSIDPAESFVPDVREELTFVVSHRYPCELTVTIEDLDGQTVRRLASRQPSRPEQLCPRGSTFTWNGRLSGGEPAAPGLYRIRVKAYIGDETYETVSEPVALAESAG